MTAIMAKTERLKKRKIQRKEEYLWVYFIFTLKLT